MREYQARCTHVQVFELFLEPFPLIQRVLHAVVRAKGHEFSTHILLFVSFKAFQWCHCHIYPSYCSHQQPSWTHQEKAAAI